jgi:hypothetical protein
MKSIVYGESWHVMKGTEIIGTQDKWLHLSKKCDAETRINYLWSAGEIYEISRLLTKST